MRLKGSATIEVAYMMPIMILIITVTVYLGFFFHDKIILQGVIYEGVVIGYTTYRTEGDVSVEDIEDFIAEKSTQRFVYFPEPEVTIEVTDTAVIVEGVTQRNQMTITVSKEMQLWEPESEIRESLILQEVLEDLEEEE